MRAGRSGCTDAFITALQIKLAVSLTDLAVMTYQQPRAECLNHELQGASLEDAFNSESFAGKPVNCKVGYVRQLDRELSTMTLLGRCTWSFLDKPRITFEAAKEAAINLGGTLLFLSFYICFWRLVSHGRLGLESTDFGHCNSSGILTSILLPAYP